MIVVSQFDLQVAGRTLWQEARSENADGQDGVAHVFWNRLRDGRWGDRLSTVCLWTGQFDGWRFKDPSFAPSCELDDSNVALVALMARIQAAETAFDPTNGATHYYAPHVVPEPFWVRGNPAKKIPPAIFCGQHGTQLFYKGVP